MIPSHPKFSSRKVLTPGKRECGLSMWESPPGQFCPHFPKKTRRTNCSCSCPCQGLLRESFQRIYFGSSTGRWECSGCRAGIPAGDSDISMDLGSSGWDGSQSHPCLPERDLARKKSHFPAILTSRGRNSSGRNKIQAGGR